MSHAYWYTLKIPNIRGTYTKVCEENVALNQPTAGQGLEF